MEVRYLALPIIPKRQTRRPFPKAQRDGVVRRHRKSNNRPRSNPLPNQCGSLARSRQGSACTRPPGKTKLGVYDRTLAYEGHIKGAWSFPNGAVIAKTLSLEMEKGNPATERRIETQILHRYKDQWHAVNYLWHEDQTDALLAPDEGSDSLFEVKDPGAPGGASAILAPRQPHGMHTLPQQPRW